jgi:hypothetical protein
MVEEAVKVVDEVLGDATELREEETALLLGRRQLLAVRSSPPRKRTAPSGSAWFYAVGGLARGEAQSTLMLGELDSTAHRGWYSV